MLRYFLLFLICIQIPLFSFELSPFFMELHGPEAISQPIKYPRIDQHHIIEGVNVITGFYHDHNIDLVTNGIDPLMLERNYHRLPKRKTLLFDPDAPNALGWYCNYIFHACMDKSLLMCGVADKGGGLMLYKRDNEEDAFAIPCDYLKGYMNDTTGEISGQHHLTNFYISQKEKRNFYLHSGDGSVRHYWGKLKFNKRQLSKLQLVSERKPSGNIVHFSEDEIKTMSEDGNILLNSLKCSETWRYDRSVSLKFESSDHRIVQLIEGKRIHRGPGKQSYNLHSVCLPDGGTIYYHYNDHPFKGNDLLTLKERCDGRFLKIEYDQYRVSALFAPVGHDSTPIKIRSFIYEEQSTDVLDAYNNRTRYLFDENKRIISIFRWNGAALFNYEENIWDAKGCLLIKKMFNEKGECLFARCFEYDAKCNIVKEELVGNLTGKCEHPIIVDSVGYPIKESTECYAKTYTYTNDDRNLLLSESDGISTIKYSYYDNTNLLKDKLIYEGDKIRIRQFRSYDRMKALCELIIDDGDTEEKDNLSACSYRSYTKIYNRDMLPGVGMPACKEEGYHDFLENECMILKSTRYSYNIHNECIKEDIFDKDGMFAYSIEKEFDQMGRCIFEKDPLNHVKHFSYDLNGNLISEVCDDKTIEYFYDFSNRLIAKKISDQTGSSEIKKYQYNLLGDCISEIDDSGNEIQHKYNAFGQKISTLLPKTLDENDNAIFQEIHYIYDAAGNLVETQNQNTKTKTSYNIRGQPISIKSSDTEERFFYDLRGNCVEKIASNGTKTFFTYDYLDRVISTSHFNLSNHLLAKTTSTYNAFFLLDTEDAEGYHTSLEYDCTGKAISVQKQIDFTTTTLTQKAYDSFGHLIVLKEWFGYSPFDYIVTRMTYDSLGHVLEKKIESSQKEILEQRNYIYDTRGNLIKESSCLGFNAEPSSYTYKYDVWGRRIEEISPIGEKKITLYPSATQKVEIDPHGNRTETSLNARGGIEKVTRFSSRNELLAEELCRYDGEGNLTLKKWRRGPSDWSTARFIYEKGKRVQMIEEEACENPRITRYSYNRAGELSLMETPLTTHTFTYDAFGRVHQHQAISKSGDENVCLVYFYDLNNNLIKVCRNGKETLRGYDGQGCLLWEKQESGHTVTYTYDRLQRRTQFILPDASTICYTYRSLYISSISRHLPSGKLLYTHHYKKRNFLGKATEVQLIGNAGSVVCSFDLKGRLHKIKSDQWEQQGEYDHLGNLITLSNQDAHQLFSYTPLNQISKENGFHTQSYTYDYLDNRLDGPIHFFNQLSHSDRDQFIWDENGRLIKTSFHTCSYSALDEMTKCDKTNYSYDGLHRRIQKDNVYFLYDGLNEIGIIDAQGKLLEFRLLGEGKAELGATVAIEMDEKCYAVISDLRGNVAALIDFETGELCERYQYSAFGLINDQQTTKNSWTYAGKRLDAESGWFFFGRRYYIPEIGRWTTPDPVEGTGNSYAFVHNNPLTHFDLFGYYDSTGPLQSRNCIDFFGKLGQRTMGVVEWIGKNLIPVPGLRDVVEALGRAGGGGKLLQTSEYLLNYTRIHRIDGNKIHGQTECWVNGIATSFDEALKIGELISKMRGGAEVYVLYNGSNGLLTDLIECSILKLRPITPPEKMIIYFIKETLKNSPDEIIHIHAHSQGGLHLYNAGSQLPTEARNSVHVTTYGSAKLISKEIFPKVENYVSHSDFVSIFDFFNYAKARLGYMEEVFFIKPTSWNPIKEHSIENTTYMHTMELICDIENKKFFPTNSY